MSARWSVGLGIAVAAVLCAAAEEPPDCLLFRAGADATPAATCLSCHALSGIGNHVVDVTYGLSQSAELRPVEEVVRRGIHLPDGQVRCTTCHDARSPWKDRIALPPGTKAVKAVDPRNPSTYERAPVPAQPGDAVSVKPLCLACHAMD